VLGNVGKTVEAAAVVPFPQMVPATGNTAALKTLNDGLAAGKYKVLFSYAANPVFTAPGVMKFKDNMAKAGFKVAFAHYLDETAMQADLVLPLDSALEDWGTQVPEYMAEGAQINIQQPLMEKLHAGTDGKGTRGMGDILLALIKQRRAEDYKKFDDYYAYLRAAVLQNKGAFGGGADDDVFWNEMLSKGIIKLAGAKQALSGKAGVAGLSLPAPAAIDAQYPLQLIPSVNASLRDGREYQPAVVAGITRSVDYDRVGLLGGNSSQKGSRTGDRRGRYRRSDRQERLGQSASLPVPRNTP